MIFLIFFHVHVFAGEDPRAQQEFKRKAEDDTQAAPRKREGTRRESKVGGYLFRVVTSFDCLHLNKIRADH